MNYDLKIGARNAARDQQRIQEIHDHALALGAKSPAPVEWESKTDGTMSDDTPVTFGGEIKALGNGKVGGYLVRFTSESDPDLTGDYFDARTDFGEPSKLPVLYHHGLDAKVGRRRIGTADVTRDDVGLWAEAQLNLRDEYEKMIYALAEKNKLGWSSGAAAHTVERARGGKAAHITQWYIAEASLTPTPAEWRNGVTSIKSLQNNELPQVDAQADNGADAASKTEAAAEPSQEIFTEAPTGASEVKTMDEQEKQALLAEIKQTATDAVKAAMQDAQPATPAAAQLKGAPAFNQTPRGDDAFKAFNWFLHRGDPSGIRTGEAYNDFLKTDYQLLEGTQYQGQEAVPTEVYAGIVERRNQISVMRAAGAMTINANSNAMVVPIEKADPQSFGLTTINGSNTFTTLTQQPLDKLAATIYMFTYNLPYDLQLIDDATFSVEGWGARYVGRGLGLTENTYMLMGTGSSQPQGAVYAGTSGVTAASATAVTAAEVVKAYYTLAAEYRDNVVWVMAGGTEATVRGLTASTSFPFTGNSGFNGGVGMGGIAQGDGWLVSPKTRVYNSSAMDAIAASKKPISVMNPEAGYAIVDRKGLTVLRDPYSAANKGLVNIWFYARFGGGVVNAAAIQNIVTPSA